MTSIQFLGAAGTVTGSRYLIESGRHKILVDCGMFQGLKNLRLRNWDEFPIEPSEISAIILTHAHIDHSGYIPRLINEGFKGLIYSTAATKDLCQILLPDSGYLAEEEAEYLNLHKRSKHNPALPLYTYEDAKAAINFFRAVPFNQKFKVGGFQAEFHYAGHILGAASVVVETPAGAIGFSGDIGRRNDPILHEPKMFTKADYLVTESTYGNRRHQNILPEEEIANIINRTVQRDGVLIIPSFAVGRAQSLMYYLWILKKQNRIPNIPMYLNSPMAVDVNDVWMRYPDLHRLSAAQAREVCATVKYVRSAEESKALNEKPGPMLIISASGMLSGGRVLHHLKKFAPDPKNTILLAGFQSAGTRGEALEHGVPEIKIHGQQVPVRAEVCSLPNISAHADYTEIIDLYRRAGLKPRKTFVTHGEQSAAQDLGRRLTEELRWDCEVPQLDQKIEL